MVPLSGLCRAEVWDWEEMQYNIDFTVFYVSLFDTKFFNETTKISNKSHDLWKNHL